MLVRRYQRPIYWLALRYVGNDADAKDVAQRALVQAFIKVRELRDGGSFRGWVYRVAANLALNVRARSQAGGAARRRPGRGAGAGDPLVEDEAAAAAARGGDRSCRRSSGWSSSCASSRSCRFARWPRPPSAARTRRKVNFHHALKRLRVLMNEEDGQ